MSKWVIEHHKNLCIGCGVCAVIEPDHWEMQGDKAHLKASKQEKNGKIIQERIELDDLAQNQEAADACPVPCIFIKKRSSF